MARTIGRLRRARLLAVAIALASCDGQNERDYRNALEARDQVQADAAFELLRPETRKRLLREAYSTPQTFTAIVRSLDELPQDQRVALVPDLTAAAQLTDPAVVQQALASLLKMHKAEALVPLLVSDHKPLVRALASSGAQALPVLDAAGDAPDSKARLAALSCVEQIENQRAVLSFIQKLARDKTVSVRREALGLLKGCADASSLGVLSDALRDREPDLLHDAGEALAALGAQALQVLEAELPKRAASGDKVELLNQIEKVVEKHPQAEQSAPLMALVQQEYAAGSAAVRAASVRVASSLKRPESSELFERALADEAPEVRRSGVQATRVLEAPTKQLQAKLIALLDDTDPGVKAAAIPAVGQHRLAGAVPALVELSKSDDERQRSEALDALVRIPKAAPFFRQRLASSSDYKTRVTSLRALACLRDPESRPLFERAIATERQEARAVGVSGLAALGDSSVPNLVSLLADSNADVRHNAEAALTALSPEHVSEALQESLRTSSFLRAEQARVALAVGPCQALGTTAAYGLTAAYLSDGKHSERALVCAQQLDPNLAKAAQSATRHLISENGALLVLFAPDGKVVTVRGDGKTREFDQIDDVFAISRSGRVLAVREDGGLALYDSGTGAKRSTLRSEEPWEVSADHAALWTCGRNDCSIFDFDGSTQLALRASAPFQNDIKDRRSDGERLALAFDFGSFLPGCVQGPWRGDSGRWIGVWRIGKSRGFSSCKTYEGYYESASTALGNGATFLCEPVPTSPQSGEPAP